MFTQESTLRNQVFGELNKFCQIEYRISSSEYDYIRVKLHKPLSENKTIALDEMSYFGKIYDLFNGFHLCDFWIDKILDKDDSVDLFCHFTESQLVYPNVVSEYVKSHISFTTEYSFSKRNRYTKFIYAMFTNGTELRQVIGKNINLCRIRECRDYDIHGSEKYFYGYLYGDFDFENHYVHRYGEIFDKVYGLPIGEIYVVSSLPRDWLDNDAKQVMLFRICNDKIKTQEDANNYMRIKEKIKSEEIFMCEYEAVTYENIPVCTINLYI